MGETLRCLVASAAFLIGLLPILSLGQRPTTAAPEPHSVIGVDSKLIFVSTLSGWLRAVDPFTGEVRWSLKEEPVVRVPVDVRAGFTFLPDPQDGSLYLLREGRLKKLPFTIPQLVAASPCKSADGVLYAGSKKDVWIGIDVESGQKLETLSQANSERTCPAATGGAASVFIGRTEYSISMFDGANRERRWNGTFTDYSSHALPEDQEYALGHYASSSDGRVLTVERESGQVLWEADLGQGSPVVALYMLQGDGLHRLPFTSVGNETLRTLIEESGSDGRPYRTSLVEGETEKKLHPTLYVGETENGLYALPSLVDEATVTILPAYLGPKLIEGPAPLDPGLAPEPPASGRAYVSPDVVRAEAAGRTREGELLLLGYHDRPETIRHRLVSTQGPHPELFRPSLLTGPASTKALGRRTKPRRGVDEVVVEDASGNRLRIKYIDDDDDDDDEWNIFRQMEKWYYSKEGRWLLLLGTSTLTLFLTVLYLMCRGGGGGEGSTSGGSRGRSSNSSRGLAFWRRETELPEGWHPIGAIQFNPKRILGHGCEGTVVYEGQFDGRAVAVKRVVSDFVNLADREVDLLRESDTHPNVIRYFCTEADSQFRYIALELCWGTLQDWVKDSNEMQRRCQLEAPAILSQATQGLAHLHSLKIVHRDIKPQNVLFTGGARPSDPARVLISDFGLCKRINFGRNSISKRSGVAGTDGWIAPEVLRSEHSVTTAVDMFSLGCVFYYVAMSGEHPFGESLRRQANILENEFDDSRLCDSPAHLLLGNLVAGLLRREPMSRPSAKAVLKHPYFWSPAQVLAFFQEVSDRVEKEESGSAVLRSLETGARSVVRNDWRSHICPALQEDLRKFRTYKGLSVRDLLRALRNKRHHYRELPPALRASLGPIPDSFVGYFAGRFPRLLPHAYDAMRIVGEEAPFQQYYEQAPSAFRQPPPPPPVAPPSPPDSWEDKDEASIERIRPRAEAEREESIGQRVQFRPGTVFAQPSPKQKRPKDS